MELTATLEKLSYASLNPMQEKLVAEGLLEGGRAVVSAPTASGKTLLALLRIVKFYEKIENRGKKTIYVVPLRALASEKFNEFTVKLATFELTVGVSTGDYDSSAEELAKFDVLILTSEKFDSILRHRPAWAREIGLAIFDECHTIGDEMRGPTLEMVMTKMHVAETELLCLSATIPNATEMAQWLHARLFTSNYRPTKLIVGVGTEKIVKFHNEELPSLELGEKRQLYDTVKAALASKQNAQVLVFVATRRSAEATSRELSKEIGKGLKLEEKEKLGEASQRILKALPQPTDQCKNLAQCIASGVAFHHAGIVDKQRTVIEESFKQEKTLKVIVCTTTLAMGIDYPASWVIVKDLKRFTGEYSDFVPCIEVRQMLGRSGRPAYDDVGVGILLSNKRDAMDVWDKYVYGEVENIYSKLSSEPALRMHSLSLVASGQVSSFEELFKFFSQTLFANQYGNEQALFDKIERIARELMELDFLREKNGKLVATPIGKRVSELYIDPLTAAKLLEVVKRKLPLTTFDLLFALCDANEMRPLIKAKRSEEKMLWEEAYNALEEFPAWDAEALNKYKTAKTINAWINEATEQQMLHDFEMPPGIWHAKVRNTEWIAYCLRELAFLENQSERYLQAKRLQRRIKHGIKEELLSLCKVRGIGRVRARKLFNAGIKTAEQLQMMEKEEVKRIMR